MYTLMHTPFGLEHPYEHLPEERFPRRPLADQPCIIGLVTRPSGAVAAGDALSRAWRRPGPAPAGAARRGPGVRRWRKAWALNSWIGKCRSIRMCGRRKSLRRPWGKRSPIGRRAALPATAAHARLYAYGRRSGVAGGGYTIDAGGRATCWSHRQRRQGEQAPGLPALLGVEWLTDGDKARRVRLRFACPRMNAFMGWANASTPWISGAM